MTTVFTHSFVALIISKFANVKTSELRIWLYALFLGSMPDLDVISFALGIPYDHMFGHRGLSHSILFAVISGILAGNYAFKRQAVANVSALRLSVVFSLIIASHGILDALTNGGLGVGFFAPFDGKRYFFPYTPIRVSPIGLNFFGKSGVVVLVSELKSVVAPSIFVLSVFLLGKKIVFGRKLKNRSEL